MVRNRDGNGGKIKLFLHDDMAASATDFMKTMTNHYRTHLFPG